MNVKFKFDQLTGDYDNKKAKSKIAIKNMVQNILEYQKHKLENNLLRMEGIFVGLITKNIIGLVWKLII